ncbi:MAG: hypothetical protein WAX69_23805 [Victivallales bacterium]
MSAKRKKTKMKDKVKKGKSKAAFDSAANPDEAAKTSDAKSLPQDKFWIHSGRGLQAMTNIDLSRSPGPVNRSVFGACIMWPSNSEVAEGVPDPKSGRRLKHEAIEASMSFLKGGSVRLWARSTPDWDDWWIDFCDKVGPGRRYIFADWVTHPDEPIYYRSENDNNLFPHQTPQAFGDFVRRLNRQAHPNHPNGLGIEFWELWNEPVFPRSGAWPAEDHARFCVDAARRMKEADPSIKIGPHILHDPEWNERTLSYMAEHGKGLIDFIVNHYYDTLWFQQWDKYGSYIGRVAYSTEMELRLRRDMDMVRRLGGGRWEFAVTEWNNHPQRYDWPGESTRDMAVALFQASTLRVFMKEGVAAAQVFALRSNSFGLFKDEAAHEKYPTFHVFDLYGRYFRGEMLVENTFSPSFVWDWETTREGVTTRKAPPRQVPYVDILACRDGQTVVLMAINKHPDEAIRLKIGAVGGTFISQKAEITTLSSDDKEGTEAILREATADIGSPSGVELPPHSFSAIRIGKG